MCVCVCVYVCMYVCVCVCVCVCVYIYIYIYVYIYIYMYSIWRETKFDAHAAVEPEGQHVAVLQEECEAILDELSVLDPQAENKNEIL